MQRKVSMAHAATMRLWLVAAIVAAVDALVALQAKPDAVTLFVAVLALCAGMAVWTHREMRKATH